MKKLFALLFVFTVFFAFAIPSDALRNRNRNSTTSDSQQTTTRRSARSGRARAGKDITTTRSKRKSRTRARNIRTVPFQNHKSDDNNDDNGEETETPTETPDVVEKKSYTVDLDALNAGANSIKVCQEKMLECANNMVPSNDKKSVQLGLCKLHSNRSNFETKEKALTLIERKLFATMGNKGKAGLSPKEMAIYKTLDKQFEGEVVKDYDAVEEEDSITEMMSKMNAEMTALDDAMNTSKDLGATELFDEVFISCEAVVKTCENVIGEKSLENYIKVASLDACNRYDNNLKNKYNLTVKMVNQVKSATKMAYMKNRRKNMISTEEGFLKIQETLENSVCGRDMKDCLYCGENQTNETACISDLVSKMTSYKATVQDTLDSISYGDNTRGDSIWNAFLEKTTNKITEFARMSNYSAKENATRGLETTTIKYRKEFTKCLTGIGGDDLIAFASPDKLKAGFGELQGSKPIDYKIINASGVEETKTMNLSEFSFDKLYDAHVSIIDSKGACGDYVDLFKNDLRLLNENPNVDKNLLPWNFDNLKLKGKLEAQINKTNSGIKRLQLAKKGDPKGNYDNAISSWMDYRNSLKLQLRSIEMEETKLTVFADDIFIKIVNEIEAKANNNLQNNRGQLMEQQLAFLAKRVEGYEANRGAEVRISNADKEVGIAMREKDSEVHGRDSVIAMADDTADKDLLVSQNTNLSLEDTSGRELTELQQENLRLEDTATTDTSINTSVNYTRQETEKQNAKEVLVNFVGKNFRGRTEGIIGHNKYQIGKKFTCDKETFGKSSSYLYKRKCKIGTRVVATNGNEYTIVAGDVN